jgi:cell division protease FtsH
MGPLTFGKREEQIFLGREISKTHDYSEETAVRIDQETKKFITDNNDRARHLLVARKDTLLKIADELLVREVLDADQVSRLVKGQTLQEPVPRKVMATVRPDDTPRRETPERPSLVPPLGTAVPQE